MNLTFVSLRPNTTWSLLCCFSHGSQGCSLASSIDGQLFHEAVGRWAYKFPGANLDCNDFSFEFSTPSSLWRSQRIFLTCRIGHLHSWFHKAQSVWSGGSPWHSESGALLDDLWEICSSLPISKALSKGFMWYLCCWPNFLASYFMKPCLVFCVSCFALIHIEFDRFSKLFQHFVVPPSLSPLSESDWPMRNMRK